MDLGITLPILPKVLHTLSGLGCLFLLLVISIDALAQFLPDSYSYSAADAAAGFIHHQRQPMSVDASDRWWLYISYRPLQFLSPPTLRLAQQALVKCWHSEELTRFYERRAKSAPITIAVLHFCVYRNSDVFLRNGMSLPTHRLPRQSRSLGASRRIFGGEHNFQPTSSH